MGRKNLFLAVSESQQLSQEWHCPSLAVADCCVRGYAVIQPIVLDQQRRCMLSDGRLMILLHAWNLLLVDLTKKSMHVCSAKQMLIRN